MANKHLWNGNAVGKQRGNSLTRCKMEWHLIMCIQFSVFSLENQNSIFYENCLLWQIWQWHSFRFVGNLNNYNETTHRNEADFSVLVGFDDIILPRTVVNKPSFDEFGSGIWTKITYLTIETSYTCIHIRRIHFSVLSIAINGILFLSMYFAIIAYCIEKTNIDAVRISFGETSVNNLLNIRLEKKNEQRDKHRFSVGYPIHWYSVRVWDFFILVEMKNIGF